MSWRTGAPSRRAVISGNAERDTLRSDENRNCKLSGVACPRNHRYLQPVTPFGDGLPAARTERQDPGQVAAEFDLQLAVLGYQSHLIDQCT